jgi:hypothetical protein
MRTLTNLLGRTAALSAALGAVIALSACGPGEARSPNPTRPLDERRAIEVIRRAVTQEGVKPAPGREVTLVSSNKPLQVDVSIEGKEYGIAYITAEDAEKLGNAIPAKNQPDEKLHLARAGEEGGVRIVLLYQDNYRYDDLIGESHEQTTITAERLLTRDVQDFITYAKTQKYK